MEILQNIDETMTKIQAQKEKVTEELITLPVGKLQHSGRGKNIVVYQSNRIDKCRKRKTITHDFGIQTQLAKKAALERELEQLNKYEKALMHASELLHAAGEVDSYGFLLKTFPWLDQSVIKDACSKPHIDDPWESEDFEHFSLFPEQKVHLTSRGLYVRSKSEMLIAEKLYAYNLVFRYEQVIHIDKLSFAPDFTIKRHDGKIMYWEHEGRTDSEKYLARQHNKNAAYASVGIVPWDNLIITYDTADGTINLKIIESEIRNKLLYSGI